MFRAASIYLKLNPLPPKEPILYDTVLLIKNFLYSSKAVRQVVQQR